MGPLWKVLSPLGMANKSGGAGTVTLFDDSFATDGAISEGARTADPGPGSATITDSTDVWSSISGGILTPSKGFTVLLEPDYQTESFSYTPGRALIARITPDGLGGNTAENRIFAGWSNGDGTFDKSTYLAFRTETISGINSGIQVDLQGSRLPIGLGAYPSAGTYTEIAVVMTPTYMYDDYWIYSGDNYTAGNFYVFVNKKLRFISLWGIPPAWSDFYGRITHSFSGIAPRSAAEVDYVRVKDVAALSDESFTTVRTLSPAWDNTYTADADGIYQFLFTTVASPSDAPEMRFRVQDANNYWTIYFSVAENCYCVDSVESGTPTRRLTGADATSTGMWNPDGYKNGYRILAEGTKLTVYSLSYGFVYPEGEITLDYLTAQTGVAIVQTGSEHTAESLVCYPLSSVVYDALE